MLNAFVSQQMQVICEWKWAGFFFGQACTHPEQFAICHLNFPIYEHGTLKRAVTLITKDRTQIEIETRATSICTFYSSISQQFISESTVNISFHKKDCEEGQNNMCGIDLLYRSMKGDKFWYYSKVKFPQPC